MVSLIVAETRIPFVAQDGPSLVGLLGDFPIGRVFAALLASLHHAGECDTRLLVRATREDHGQWASGENAWEREGPAVLRSIGVDSVAQCEQLSRLCCPRVVADLRTVIADRDSAVKRRVRVKGKELEPIRNVGEWVRRRFETFGDSHSAAIRAVKAERAALLAGVARGHQHATKEIREQQAIKTAAQELKERRERDEPKMLADFREADDELLAAAVRHAIDHKRTDDTTRSQLIAFRTKNSQNPRAIAESHGELRWHVWPSLMRCRLARNVELSQAAEAERKKEKAARRG